MSSEAEVASFIRNANEAELRHLQEEIRWRYQYLAQEALRKFTIGQRVRFKAGRRRFGYIEGEVSAINRTSVTVSKCSDGNKSWRVHPSFLEEVVKP